MNNQISKILNIAHLMFYICFSPFVFAESNDQVESDLQIVETWRASPHVITGRCNLIDSAGIQKRESSFGSWRNANRDSISRINQNVEAIIPPLMNGNNIYLNLVDPFKDRILVEIIQITFSGKTAVEVSLFCHSYTPDSSADNMEIVTNALNRLEKWRKENHVSLKLK